MARNTTATQPNQASNATVASQPQEQANETVVDRLKRVDLSRFGSNKSAKIRFLKSEGFSTADIARFLGIKYQFARNVLVQANGRAATQQPQGEGEAQSA